MNEKEFLNWILSIPTEDRVTEFKRMGETSVVSKIIETIVAMTNTDGGIIILGVDDPEKTKHKGLQRVCGIEENKENYDAISREIERIIPPLTVVWPPIQIDCETGKTIAILKVPKAGEHIHAINNKVYIRLEKGNKVLTPYEVIKYSYARGFQKADRELVEVDFDLLKTDYFEKWRKARKIDSGDLKDILFHAGLCRKDEHGNLKPIRAAVLLFAYYPHNVMDAKCAIRVYQYEGTIEKIGETPNLISKPKTIDGPIVKQIEEAQEYVLTLLRAGIRLPSSGFVNKYRIPERAIKEAITNAVIHRDYYMKRDIEINIYEDRVEVISAGLFPYNITSSNIGFVRSEGYRNDLLVKHLRDFPDPPNLDRNEGVRAMRAEMDKHNLYPPIYITYPIIKDSVCCMLLNTVRVSEWDKVYSYLSKTAKYIANEDVRKILGKSDTVKVSKLLKKWVDQGLLVRTNSNSKRNIKYRLPSGEMADFLFTTGKGK
ncbi:MAG: RNA-binding domain-containing protein [Candidatus Omnitrophota bacterium]